MTTLEKSSRGSSPLLSRVVVAPSGVNTDGLMTHPLTRDPWRICIDQLHEIRNLEDDWDGLGAPAPSADVVDSAIQLIRQIKPRAELAPMRVVPGVTGSVVFEWHHPDGSYEALEITKPYSGEYISVLAGEQPTSSDFDW